MLTLARAIAWAAQLNRTLILGPLVLPRGTDFDATLPPEQWTWLEDLYDFSSMIEAGKAVSGKQMWFHRDVLPTPWRVVKVGRNGIYENTTGPPMIFPRAFTDMHASLVDIHSIMEDTYAKQNHSCLVDLLGGCSDDVLMLDGLYFAPDFMPPDYHAASSRALLNSLTLSKDSADVLHRLSLELRNHFNSEQNYTCLQVRRGDFKYVCEHPAPWMVNETMNQSCWVSDDELSATINHVNGPVLVISNDESHLDPVLASSKWPSVTSSWIRDQISKVKPGLSEPQLEAFSLTMDVELCASSKQCVVNKWSTVGNVVLQRRRGMQKGGCPAWGHGHKLKTKSLHERI